MPTYIYETTDPTKPIRNFEVKQSVHDDPLRNDPETGETLCIACNLCSLACPEHCIEVGWERTEAGKKALTTFTFDISRCMFCGLCEDACPTPCLELTQDFELSMYDRRNMKWDRQKLEEGNQPVVYTK